MGVCVRHDIGISDTIWSEVYRLAVHTGFQEGSVFAQRCEGKGNRVARQYMGSINAICID